MGVTGVQTCALPIVVAVNKIDKEGAQPERVRTELTNLGLQPEEWGGETMFVDVSAKTKQNLEDLLRSEEHTSELQSRQYLVCRLLLEKKKKTMLIYL